MKRSAIGHRKFKKLHRILGAREYVVVGLLEYLWHLTAREAPRGDIGRISDEDIAMALDWDREPEELINALLEAGWLDRSEEHRLIIHDWHEHADEAVKKYIARNHLTFASKTYPATPAEKQSVPDNGGNDAPCLDVSRNVSPARSQSLSQKPEARNTLMAAQAPDESETKAAAERERAEAERLEKKRAEAEAKKAAELELGAQWASFLEEYPPRVGDRGLQPGRQKFEAILRNRRATFAQLLEGVQRYRRWCDHEGQTNTKFVKQIPTWLNQGCWGEDWTIIPRPNAGSSSSPTGRNRLSRADAEAIVAAAGLLEVA